MEEMLYTLPEAERNKPTAERILSLLVNLLADQHGVKVKYSIVTNDEGVENE